MEEELLVDMQTQCAVRQLYSLEKCVTLSALNYLASYLQLGHNAMLQAKLLSPSHANIYTHYQRSQ